MKETLPWVAVIVLAATLFGLALSVLIYLLTHPPANNGGKRSLFRLMFCRRPQNMELTAGIGDIDASESEAVSVGRRPQRKP